MRPSSRPKRRPSSNPRPSLSLRTCEPSPWLLWFFLGQPTLLPPKQPAQQPPRPHPANLCPCNTGRPDQFNSPARHCHHGAERFLALSRAGLVASDSHQPRRLKGLLWRLLLAAEERFATIAGQEPPLPRHRSHFLGPPKRLTPPRICIFCSGPLAQHSP